MEEEGYKIIDRVGKPEGGKLQTHSHSTSPDDPSKTPENIKLKKFKRKQKADKQRRMSLFQRMKEEKAQQAEKLRRKSLPMSTILPCTHPISHHPDFKNISPYFAKQVNQSLAKFFQKKFKCWMFMRLKYKVILAL